MAHRRTHLHWIAASLLGSGLATFPLAAEIGGAAGAAAAPLEAPPAAAFAGQLIWGGEVGGTLARLGLRIHGLYRFRGSRPEVIEVPIRERCCLSRAEMAPTGDLIAYSNHISDPARPYTDRFL